MHHTVSFIFKRYFIKDIIDSIKQEKPSVIKNQKKSHKTVIFSEIFNSFKNVKLNLNNT